MLPATTFVTEVSCARVRAVFLIFQRWAVDHYAPANRRIIVSSTEQICKVVKIQRKRKTFNNSNHKIVLERNVSLETEARKKYNCYPPSRIGPSGCFTANNDAKT